MAAHTAWVLNLDAEYELADPRGYTPSRAALQRVREQSARVQGLVAPGDVVLCVDRAPAAGEPEHSVAGWSGRAWCPTPRALARLAHAGARPPAAPALEVLQRVNDRAFGVALTPGPLGSRHVRCVESALELLTRPSPSGRWLAKRAFGLAGRGHRRFEAAPDGLDLAWLRSSFRLGHGVVIEPLVERLVDFVQHGLVARSGDLLLGEPLWQDCDVRGMWQRTRGPAREALATAEGAELERALRAAGEALHGAGYFGPFGVDAFRYRDGAGTLRFNPMVEINARYCMGWGGSGLPLGHPEDA